MADIHDVARLAGVSTATVSRALRGLPNVSESTRIKVLRAAAELRYTVSPHASGLSSGRSRTVGVVVPYVARWFFGHVIDGAEQVLRAAGFDVLLYAIDDAAARARFFNELPARGRVDAIMVLTIPLEPGEVEIMHSLGIPLAIVHAEAEGFSSIRIDDYAAARLAVQHLVNLGHTRVGLISGGDVPFGFTAPHDRRRAYYDVMNSNGLPTRDEWDVGADFTIAGGERAMTRLLAAAEPPTAVFAMSDEMALGAMKALRKHGIAVPRDMSLVGFDNHELADLVGLTTVAQPVVEQGELAAQLLLDALNVGYPDTSDGRVVTPPARVVTTVELIVRESTAAPASQTARDTGGPSERPGFAAGIP